MIMMMIITATATVSSEMRTTRRDGYHCLSHARATVKLADLSIIVGHSPVHARNSVNTHGYDDYIRHLGNVYKS